MLLTNYIESDWKWIDSTPFTYTNWAPEEDPYTLDGCAVMRPGRNGGQWIINDCYPRSNYICRIPKCAQHSTQYCSLSSSTVLKKHKLSNVSSNILYLTIKLYAHERYPQF